MDTPTMHTISEELPVPKPIVFLEPVERKADEASAPPRIAPLDTGSKVIMGASAEPPKRRGRPLGSKNAAGSTERVATVTRIGIARNAQGVIQANAPIVPNYEEMGAMAAGAFVTVGVVIFGAEWQADDEMEMGAIAIAWRDYFRAKHIIEISPEWGLAIALGSYTVKRLNRPTVKEKFFGAITWIRERVKPFRIFRRTPSTAV